MLRKIIIRLCCIAAIVLLGYNKSFSQADASASASATIVVPVTVTNSDNLVFGNIAVNSAAGSVIMKATQAPALTTTGGASISASSSTPTTAVVNVSGSATYGYSVNVEPATITIINGNGNSISLAPQLSANAGTLDKNGKGAVYLGATLTVSANQPSGFYSNNGGITVTFNYN